VGRHERLRPRSFDPAVRRIAEQTAARDAAARTATQHLVRGAFGWVRARSPSCRGVVPGREAGGYGRQWSRRAASTARLIEPWRRSIAIEPEA
jgi:hypothetical protein